MVVSRHDTVGIGEDTSDSTFVVQPADITAPCAVNLGLIMGTTTAVLSWPAGGDDCNSGTAIAYELRMSPLPITESNFMAAPLVSAGPATPPPSCYRQAGLAPCSNYYFAIRHVDDAGNFSPITVRSGQTSCDFPPWEAQCFTDGESSTRMEPRVDVPAILEFAAPTPNPAGDQVRLTYAIPQELGGGALELKVFDLSGREVRTVSKGVASPGRHTVTWDLRSKAAARVHAGIYFPEVAGRGARDQAKRARSPITFTSAGLPLR